MPDTSVAKSVIGRRREPRQRATAHLVLSKLAMRVALQDKLRGLNRASFDRLLPGILLALTAVTGLVDAVSFLAFGHTFTANMTGNVVFLGFAAAGAPGLSLVRSGVALAAFVCGAVAAGSFTATASRESRWRWASLAFGAEAALMLAAGALAVRAPPDLLADPKRLYGIIALTGFAMGIRNAVVRKLAEHDLTTTVLTLTITGLAADSMLAGGNNPGWQRRVSSIVLMFAGAAAGVWLLRHSLWLPLTAASAVAGVCSILSWSAGSGHAEASSNS
jgi:uncharacterized membrane protein YoaK (UPF0700 family)